MYTYVCAYSVFILSIYIYMLYISMWNQKYAPSVPLKVCLRRPLLSDLSRSSPSWRAGMRSDEVATSNTFSLPCSHTTSHHTALPIPYKSCSAEFLAGRWQFTALAASGLLLSGRVCRGTCLCMDTDPLTLFT